MNRVLASVYKQVPNKGKPSIFILYKRLFTTCLTTVHSSVILEALVYLTGKNIKPFDSSDHYYFFVYIQDMYINTATKTIW